MTSFTKEIPQLQNDGLPLFVQMLFNHKMQNIFSSSDPTDVH